MTINVNAFGSNVWNPIKSEKWQEFNLQNAWPLCIERHTHSSPYIKVMNYARTLYFCKAFHCWFCAERRETRTNFQNPTKNCMQKFEWTTLCFCLGKAMKWGNFLFFATNVVESGIWDRTNNDKMEKKRLHHSPQPNNGEKRN